MAVHCGAHALCEGGEGYPGLQRSQGTLPPLRMQFHLPSSSALYPDRPLWSGEGILRPGMCLPLAEGNLSRRTRGGKESGLVASSCAPRLLQGPLGTLGVHQIPGHIPAPRGLNTRHEKDVALPFCLWEPSPRVPLTLSLLTF